MSMFTEFSYASVILTLFLPVNSRYLWFTTYRETYDSIHNPCCLMPETWVHVVVGITLLLCIRAEIYVISYLLQVNGRHIWFTASNSIIIFTACFMALKTCYCRWNCVTIIYICWDTFNYIIPADILNFWLPVSSGSVTDSPIEMFDPENMDSRWNFVPS